MSLVKRIETATKEKGLTFKSLERECGLGNGTIRRWETQSPRLDGLMKVADYLQLPLDNLVYGCREMATSCDGHALSETEADLIAMYRFVDDADKKTIFDITTLKYEQATGEKGSIYLTYTDTDEQQKSNSDERQKIHDEIA